MKTKFEVIYYSADGLTVSKPFDSLLKALEFYKVNKTKVKAILKNGKKVKIY